MTKVNVEQFLELQSSGWSARQIAEAFGCTTRTVTRTRARLGLSNPHPAYSGRPLDSERLNKARALIEEGLSHNQISQMLGIRHETLVRHFPGTQWTPEEGGKYARMVHQLNQIHELGRTA